MSTAPADRCRAGIVEELTAASTTWSTEGHLTVFAASARMEVRQ
jgi:hypothetical protein